MGENNNDQTTKTKNAEPTIADLFSELQKLASKNDINHVSDEIKSFYAQSKDRFENIETKMSTIEQTHNEHNDAITELAVNVEQLKQDKLRNNIRISGIIPDWDGDCKGLVMKIITKLNVQATVNDFTTYTTANNKFVIVSFYNYVHKASLLNKMRVKKSLMVEEIFPSAKSNSQLYFNDHLIPYFNELFITAFKAKKNGTLCSASSWGGRVRVRKSQSDPPIVINTMAQLEYILNADTSDQNNEMSIEETDSATASTSSQPTRGRPKKNRTTGTSATTAAQPKANKRKAGKSSERDRPDKNARTTSTVIKPGKLTGNLTNTT